MQQPPLSIPDNLPSPSPDALEVSPTLDLQYRHSNITYGPLVCLLPLQTMSKFVSASVHQSFCYCKLLCWTAEMAQWLGTPVWLPASTWWLTSLCHFCMIRGTSSVITEGEKGIPLCVTKKDPQTNPLLGSWRPVCLVMFMCRASWRRTARQNSTVAARTDERMPPDHACCLWTVAYFGHSAPDFM